MAVVKPCQGMTIGADHCRAGHVQTQSAILNRRSDGNSEYQDCSAQRIQVRNQYLGVGRKNEVDTSRAFFSVALRLVLEMWALAIFVRGFTGANRRRSV